LAVFKKIMKHLRACNTCGWCAALTLAKCNKVGSKLFWNTTPRWTRNGPYTRGKKRNPPLLHKLYCNEVNLNGDKMYKSAARLLNRNWVNKEGLDLSKEVLWVWTWPISRIFCWPPTLTACSFAVLWPTRTHSTSLERSKPPLLTQSLSKSLVVILFYFHSNWPHFNRAYVVRVDFFFATSVKRNFIVANFFNCDFKIFTS